MTGAFLETMRDEFNKMRARAFAGAGYEDVTHAGLCIVAADTGWVLLTQRAYDETDDPEVRESWEFPGGALNEGEEPFAAAQREFEEELGLPLPEGDVVNGWRSPAGNYQLFIYVVPSAYPEQGWGPNNSDWVPTDEVQAIAWVPPLIGRMQRDMKMRPEMLDFDWTLVDDIPLGVSGNKEIGDMTQQAPETEPESPAEDATEPMEEPDHSDLSFMIPDHLMVHGVLAPEATPSGDSRGFTSGAVTSRPLRLPLGWQEKTASGHDGAVTVGSIDRMARKGNLIYWEGALMSSEDADEFTDLLMFFGQYGLSIDGVKGNVDQQQSKADGMLWFDAVQVAGATACAVPAFAEAYIALGPSPDMPADFGTDTLAASGFAEGDVIGARREEFARGPGWVTDPKATNRIHDYWTKPGQKGYEQIGWGKPGDFARAKALIGEKIAKHSPDKMRFLNQIIAQWHKDALGYYPATHAKMDRAGTKASAEEPQTYEYMDGEDGFTISEDSEGGWEAVLVSSAAGGRALPPASYFERHPDTGALVIEEPDANGLRRTYGYAGEWGVCHIGHDGRCVEVPEDGDGSFASFHLGRTKTADEGYINTGLITYKVDHRDAQTILTETAQQQHYDNIAHAWAQVRLGMDDRGIWFSGVVLPGISEDDLVVIEAAGQVSGEWKYGALRALQAVNVPGFPVLRSSAAYDDEGNVIALVAAMTSTSECEPSALERMQALARAHAEARMEALRDEFNWTDVAEELVTEAEDEGRVVPVGVRDDGAVVYEKDGEVPGTDTIVAPVGEGD